MSCVSFESTYTVNPSAPESARSDVSARARRSVEQSASAPYSTGQCYRSSEKLTWIASSDAATRDNHNAALGGNQLVAEQMHQIMVCCTSPNRIPLVSVAPLGILQRVQEEIVTDIIGSRPVYRTTGTCATKVRLPWPCRRSRISSLRV